MSGYRYEDFAWPEIDVLAREERIPLLPVGTIEQHGPHLPLSTDVLIATRVCEAAAREIPDEVVLMPPVSYAFNEHHMDFPGTIAVRGHTFIDYVADVGRSLARHGFRRILLVNGHGSNVPFLDVAARFVTNETDAVCAMAPWWNLLPKELVAELRESEYMAHGCELETSVMLHLVPELVRMERAEKDVSWPDSEYFWWDTTRFSGVYFQEWFSRNSRTGVEGDPTVATAEKGRRFFAAAVENLVRLVRDFRARPLLERVDHHGRG